MRYAGTGISLECARRGSLVYRERRIEPAPDALTADQAAEPEVLALVSRHSLAAVIAALDRVARRP